MAIDAEFELDVLAKAVRSKRYRIEASRVLSKHRFTDPYLNFIWQTVSKLPPEESPTARVFIRSVEKAFPDEAEKQDAYLAVAVRVLKHNPKIPKTALKELTEYVRFTRLAESIEKSIKLLHFGKVEEAYRQIDRLRASDIKPRNYNRIQFIETWKQRMLERKRRVENPGDFICIPTRIESLDRVIIGIQKGEIGLVMGTTGRGKSIFLVHLAFWAAMYGFPTIYFTLEMPAFQVASRLDSKFLNMSYRKLKTYDLDRDDLEAIIMRFKKFSKRLKSKLDIVSIPPRRASINNLIEVIEDRKISARNEKEGETALLVVDSPDHMKPIDGGDNIRVSQTNIYWDLAWLVSDDSGYDLAAWASTQAAAKAAGRFATSEDTAESYDKARIASIILSINQTKEQESLGTEADLYIPKNRDGESKKVIPLAMDLPRMHLEERELEEDEEDDEE